MEWPRFRGTHAQPLLERRIELADRDAAHSNLALLYDIIVTNAGIDVKCVVCLDCRRPSWLHYAPIEARDRVSVAVRSTGNRTPLKKLGQAGFRESLEFRNKRRQPD